MATEGASQRKSTIPKEKKILNTYDDRHYPDEKSSSGHSINIQIQKTDSPSLANSARKVRLTFTQPSLNYRKTPDKDCSKRLKLKKQNTYGFEHHINDDSYMRRMSSKKSLRSRSKGKLSRSASTFKNQSSQKY